MRVSIFMPSRPPAPHRSVYNAATQKPAVVPTYLMLRCSRRDGFTHAFNQRATCRGYGEILKPWTQEDDVQHWNAALRHRAK